MRRNMELMRLPLVFALACAAYAQPGPFTLDQVMSAAFPSSLTAAPGNNKVAWVSNTRGVRNIMVAEPPDFRARKLTAYTADDGQELQELRWTPDQSSIVYVRGGSANPAINPSGVSQELWLVRLDGSAPRRLGQGHSPAISPRGDRVAFSVGGQVWWVPLDGKGSAGPAFQARGFCETPIWSPDGARLAFTSVRNDHSLIGVYDMASATLRYLDPSTDADASPAWTPDGRSIAFIRIPSDGLRQVREARRTGEPWSIRVASVETGAGRQIWRAREGPGSVFRAVTAQSQLIWAGGRIVFPWEADGWTHLYSIPGEGGDALLLTPGEFEVEDVAAVPARPEIVYSSNQSDIDRRHLWRVAAAGGTPAPVTTGQGIECSPAPLSDGAIALLRSDARTPLHAAVIVRGENRAMDPDAIPPGFPLQRMAQPQPVVFAAADGLQIHGQVFLPPGRAGRAPAVVFFHGGPRRQMLLGWHYMYYYSNAYAFNQYLASQGYVVLSVNFRSGVGYGLDFREALNYGASGASEFADVQGAATYLRSRPDVDASRIAAWGGSYGGFLTAMALARASDTFRAGVDFHGAHDWARELEYPRRRAGLQSGLRFLADGIRERMAFPRSADRRRRRPGRAVQPDSDAGRRAAQTEGGHGGTDLPRRSSRIPVAPDLGGSLRGFRPVPESAHEVGTWASSSMPHEAWPASVGHALACPEINMKPPNIPLEKLAALGPSCLSMTVPEAYRDDNGHMNMRWYLAIFDDAGEVLHERLGLTPEFHRRNRHGHCRSGAPRPLLERGDAGRARYGVRATGGPFRQARPLHDVHGERNHRPACIDFRMHERIRRYEGKEDGAVPAGHRGEDSSGRGGGRRAGLGRPGLRGHARIARGSLPSDMWRGHSCLPCRDSSRHVFGGIEDKRRHECRRGRQECLRHVALRDSG